MKWSDSSNFSIKNDSGVRSLKVIAIERTAKGLIEQLRLLTIRKKEKVIKLKSDESESDDDSEVEGMEIEEEVKVEQEIVAVESVESLEGLRIGLNNLPEGILNSILNLILMDEKMELNLTNLVYLFLSTQNFIKSIKLTNSSLQLYNHLFNCSLSTLNLSNTTITNHQFTTLIQSQSSLELLNLQNTEINDKSINLLTTSTNTLTLSTLNLCNIPITQIGFSSIINSCTNLEGLKLTKIKNLTEKVIALSFHQNNHLLSKLTLLKLKSTLVTEISLVSFLNSSNLTSLDISYTEIKTLQPIIDYCNKLPNWNLRKLIISGLSLSTISISNLLKLVIAKNGQNVFKILKMERMSNISSSRPGLTDESIKVYLPLLKQLELDSISFLGNKGLGKNRIDPMREFIKTVGRKCLKLNLTDVPIQNRHLEELLDDDFNSSPKLQELIINSAALDDRSIPALSTLVNLHHLEIANSKISLEGLKSLVTKLEKLRILNLSACRSVPTLLRRGFFNWMEEERTRMENELIEESREKIIIKLDMRKRVRIE